MKNIDGMMIFQDGSDGDSMLFSGLLVATGDKDPIVGIKMCQTDDGRIWRSPARKNNNPRDSFSRDMALGVILYIQKTKDYEMADKWVAYILKTGGLFPAAEASDNRYAITPSLWWLMSYAGIKVQWRYRLTRFMSPFFEKLMIPFTPPGYNQHLACVSQLILAIYNGKRDTVAGKQLSTLEPRNPFFLWMAGDNEGARKLADELKAEASANGGASPEGYYGSGKQWAWQRVDAEKAYMDAVGWDFIFIDELLKMDIK